MFNVTVPPVVYSTESVQFSNENGFSFIDLYRKYGIIIPKEKRNKNIIFDSDYITNEENITNMNNMVVYKEFDVLSSEYSDIIVCLNFPIMFKIEVDENGFYYINERFNLYVYGASQKEAENNLLGAFRDQVEAFCFEDDSTLDKNAQKLKRDLKEVCKYAKKKD